MRRGGDEKLALPDDGGPAPLIDTSHPVLGLMESHPAKLGDFLEETRPDRERMRLVAQALAGTAHNGGKEEGATLLGTIQSEQATLGKLTANWRSLIDQAFSAVETGLFGRQES